MLLYGVVISVHRFAPWTGPKAHMLMPALCGSRLVLNLTTIWMLNMQTVFASSILILHWVLTLGPKGVPGFRASAWPWWPQAVLGMGAHAVAWFWPPEMHMHT